MTDSKEIFSQVLFFSSIRVVATPVFFLYVCKNINIDHTPGIFNNAALSRFALQINVTCKGGTFIYV